MGFSRVSTDPGKVAAIKNWQTPKNLKEFEAFLGIIGNYRQYLRNFATNSKLLNLYTAKGTK